MRQMIRKFYIVGIIVAITVALGMYIEFKYFEWTIKNETETNIILERDAIASDISSSLNIEAQVIKDAESYISVEKNDDHIDAFLTELANSNPAFASIYFGTPDNIMINSSGFVPPSSFDLRTRPWYLKAADENKLIFTEPFVNASKDQLIITIASPVYNTDNQFIGVVAGDISMQHIIDLVKDKYVSDARYSFLIDGKGNILAHPHYEYNLTSELINIKDVSENLSASMLQNNTGSTTILLNDTKGYLAYQPIAGTDWMVGSFIAIDEYVKADYQALMIFLLTLISSGFILFVILYLLKKRIIEPILKLDKDIQAISIEEHLSYRLKDGDDSFAVIRSSINHVLEKTQDFFEELTSKKEALTQSEERNRAIVNALPDTIFIIDSDGTFKDFHVSDESQLLLKKEEFMGKTLMAVLPPDIAFTWHDGVAQALQTASLQLFEYELKRPDGSKFFEVRMVKSSENEVIAISRNITDRKNNELYIEYLSYHDQLTGLYNRRFFEDEIVRLDNESSLPLTLAMLDVNGLKLTNDAFGHIAGDTLLTNIADLLKKECRASDVISRIGGDEFVILFPHTGSDEAAKIVKRIYQTAATTQVANIILSVSIGWETKTNISQSIDELFIKAEDHMYKKKLSESQSMRNKTIQDILTALKMKNEMEKLHSDRVSALCVKIGKAIKLDQDAIKELETAALLHDIGKIAVSDAVLNKPEALTETEYDEVKKHPEIGYQILKSADAYSALAESVLSHHERQDGTGYPRGISGNEIPLMAKIITLADAVEAMTSYRPYRRTLSKEEIISELNSHSGTQFDPDLVTIFIRDVWDDFCSE